MKKKILAFLNWGIGNLVDTVTLYNSEYDLREEFNIMESDE